MRGHTRVMVTVSLGEEFSSVPALFGESLSVRGEVVQLTRQVAYVESTVTDSDGGIVSRALATFIVRRKAE